MPLNANAADITEGSGSQSGQVSVDYSLPSGYIVTIPADVAFTDSQLSVQRAVSAKNVRLSQGSTLHVYAKSKNDFKMKNADSYINYSMLVNTAEFNESGIVLSVLSGETSGWALLDLTAAPSGEEAYAGDYTDTLTFTVAIE